MRTNTTLTGTPSAAQVLGAAPPIRRVPGARERIRAGNVASGRRIAILDDDPTGSQTVHDVSVVTVFDTAEYAAGLTEPGSHLLHPDQYPEPAGGRRGRADHQGVDRPVRAGSWAGRCRSSAGATPPCAVM